MSKTLKEWERSKGLMFTDRSIVDTEKQYTESELSDLLNKNRFSGVNYQDRERWLTENDYPITDDNLMNSMLEPKSK